MSIAATTRAPLQNVRASVSVFLALGGLSCAMTLLYLGMRAVLDVGGACASGGPYVPRVQCPQGIPLLMTGAVWGGLIFLGLYLWATVKHDVPTLVGFAWPALFLSLGWNFLAFGLDPPFGEGIVWGWIVCAAAFALMGGLPLLVMARPIMSQFTKVPAPNLPAYVLPTRDRINDVRALRRPAQPVAGDEDEGLVDALERLEKLRRSGSLTEREFEDAKRRVIRGDG
ncbi:MAG: SHOCT domain-containing protein [Actinomycetota bacterium]|nr:SHOCT domain-containing protein [Actinomycetota bacterium]